MILLYLKIYLLFFSTGQIFTSKGNTYIAEYQKIAIAEKISLNNPDSALKIANEIVPIALQGNKEKLYLNALSVRGRAYERLGNYSEALENYIKASMLYEKNNNFSKLANVYYRISVVLKNTGHYLQAIEYAYNSLSYIQKYQCKEIEPHVYNNLGNIFLYLEDYTSASENYNKSLKISLLQKDTILTANLYNNLGLIQYNKGNYSNSLAFYSKSLELRFKLKNYLGMAHSYNNLGGSYTKMESFDSAKFYLTKSIKIKKRIKDIRGLTNSYYNHCMYYKTLGKTKKALLYADSSINLSKKINYKNTLRDTYYLKYKIYSNKHLSDSAIKYIEKYNALGKNIVNYKDFKKIVAFNTKIENIKEKKITSLENKRKKLNYIIIFIALVSTSILFISAFIISKIKYNNIKLKDEYLEKKAEHLTQTIKGKDKELAQNLLHLAEKNQVLDKLYQILKKTENSPSDSVNKKIKKALSFIKESSNINIWEEFDEVFNKINNDFYKNLLTKHPNLTSNEKRLVALLKLNLTTKEISALTKQSLHSITVARTRLRKKIGIDNTSKSLSNYIQKF